MTSAGPSDHFVAIMLHAAEFCSVKAKHFKAKTQWLQYLTPNIGLEGGSSIT